jgi:hypothetical protein
MQSDTIKKKSLISIAAAALSAGLAMTALSGCDESTSPPASTGLITLTAPKGGQSFKVGSVMHVTWTVKADPEAPDAVDVKVSVDEGKTWGFLRSGSIPDDSEIWGDFPWTVVDSVTIGGKKEGLIGKAVLVRVMQYSVSDPKKISTIAAPISITAP